MQHAGNRLLAGAAFAGDEHHRHGAGGDHLYLAQNLDHAGRGVHEYRAVRALALLRRHVSDALFQRAGPSGVADRGDDLLELEGLLDEVVAAELHRRHRALDRSVRGDENDLGVGRLLAHAAQDLDPVGVAQHEIEEDHVRSVLLEAKPGLGARRGDAHLEALPGERRADRLPDQGLVVRYQDLDAHRITGSWTSKVAPVPSCGGRLAATIRPPCSSKMF